ncbi:hypothetical protein BJX68DRAFT_107945 [Aspergillus pseudodeflectus]|uniref:Uncharacterized protein n=1 Tax=Aspergillus pseudodeflectus TaxID=176178 RepID=A0ABR4K7M6_9EURO
MGVHMINLDLLYRRHLELRTKLDAEDNQKIRNSIQKYEHRNRRTVQRLTADRAGETEVTPSPRSFLGAAPGDVTWLGKLSLEDEPDHVL